ncbi:hypothetical protein NW832_07630 [Synechococcus sp. R5-16]|uniref:hypothetical protein n=1 Tax=Synechococcus sp. R5-16 TaxID=2291955 RepID=UPI0039C2F9CE
MVLQPRLRFCWSFSHNPALGRSHFAHFTPVPRAGQPLELILMDILPRHGDPQPDF